MTPPHENQPIIGIDLGTTNSLVAAYTPDGPRVLFPEGESPILPSVVRYTDDGLVESIGNEARQSAIRFPRRTISSVKRLMGRSRSDCSADLTFLSYEVVEGEQSTARILVGPDRILSPQEVSAEILRALRHRAEMVLNEPIERAVITVPAYFDDAQRQATRDAGRLAGLDVVRIVNEPTAAALAYGVGLSRRQSETLAVFDLGGGTFDISLLRVTPSDPEDDTPTDFFQVLATAGDTRLGGDDVDRLMIAWILEQAGVDHLATGDEIAIPPETRSALRDIAEQTKIRLSEEESVEVAIEIELDSRTRSVTASISRSHFDEMIAGWVDRTIECCRHALHDAGLRPEDINRVVMVGGSTRIPLVRERVSEFFDTTLYTALDPDQVVALGAAVQGSILAGGEAREMLLLDVLPLSLGIETVGGAVAKLIMRNSTVPARATDMFSTSIDNQTSIKIQVLQGEREMAADCRSLGEFHLRGIPPMPAGIPQLEVEFLVDSNGVLTVSAHEKRSGKRLTAQVVPQHGLTRAEVERIERESLDHAREDMQRHRVVDLITNAKLDLKWITEGIELVGDDLNGQARQKLLDLTERLDATIRRAEADWRTVDANTFQALKVALDRASIPLHELRIAASLRGEPPTH